MQNRDDLGRPYFFSKSYPNSTLTKMELNGIKGDKTGNNFPINNNRFSLNAYLLRLPAV